MNEIQYDRMQEDAALGEALLHLLSEMYCCEPKEAAIKRAVYKYTDCGAWIEFTEKGVKIGSIVEGADYGTLEYSIGYNGDDDKFKEEFWTNMQLVENEADFIWQEVNNQK